MRMWLGAVAGVLVLAVIAGVAALLVLRARPKPAPSSDGRAIGTVSDAGLSGLRTYDDRPLRFRFSYPADWRISESGASREAEGDYLTISLVPAPSDATGTLDPPLLEVVPDPQGFSADAIARMKWGSESTTLTVTTSTAEVAGKPAVEVFVSEAAKPGRRLYTYDLIATPGGRMFRLGFSSSDLREFEAVRADVRRIVESIETY